MIERVINMNNKNVFYACPYCKEEYSEPADLAHCILSCEEKARQKEAEQKREEFAKEKKARVEEIETVAKHYQALIKEFIKDYGSYDVIRCYNGEEDDALPFMFGSKPWRMFF
jgi:hypothetical protein